MIAGLVVLMAGMSRSEADQTSNAGPLGAGELVKLFDQVPENTKLAFYDGAAYVSTDSGLYRHTHEEGLERIELTHPQGWLRSVSRVGRAGDGGGLYVAAGFQTGGLIGTWDGALFSLADPMTPRKTFNRSKLEYFAVDGERRTHATSEGSLAGSFQFILPPDDGPVLTLPDAGLVLQEVTESGARLLDGRLLTPEGAPIERNAPGDILHAQDRQAGPGFNLATRSNISRDSVVFTQFGNAPAEILNTPNTLGGYHPIDGARAASTELVLSWTGDDSGNLLGDSNMPQAPLSYRLHLPIERVPLVEPFPLQQGDLVFTTTLTTTLNATGSLWSASLVGLYPELREIDFDRVIDFVTSEGEMHFLLTGSEGMWLFSAADPTFIPEPSGGVLAWLVLGTLASRTRLPRR